MKKISVIKLTSVALAMSVFLTNSLAFANPTELNLKFKYTSRGVLEVNVDFDEPTSQRCVARHRISLYHEGKQIGDEGVIRKSVFNRRVDSGRKSTSLRARRLLGVKKDSNGKDPIMAIQTRLECGSEKIESNVEARYIICSDSTKRVSLNSYFTDLRSKLQ